MSGHSGTVHNRTVPWVPLDDFDWSYDRKGPLPWNITVWSLLAAFTAVPLWMTLELTIWCLYTFKKWSGSYFWSVLLCTWGVTIHAIGFVLRFGVDAGWILTTTLIESGWVLMVTGFALVLYSRLHFVVKNELLLTFVLAMIITDGFLFHIPTVTFEFLVANDSTHAKYVPYLETMHRVQIVGFSVQEIFIGGLYIYQTLKFLRGNLNRAMRRTVALLIIVQIVIIICDVVVTSLIYLDYYTLKVLIHSFAYGLKLHLEFVILNSLKKHITKDGMTSRGMGILDSGETDLTRTLTPETPSSKPLRKKYSSSFSTMTVTAPNSPQSMNEKGSPRIPRKLTKRSRSIIAASGHFSWDHDAQTPVRTVSAASTTHRLHPRARSSHSNHSHHDTNMHPSDTITSRTQLPHLEPTASHLVDLGLPFLETLENTSLSQEEPKTKEGPLTSHPAVSHVDFDVEKQLGSPGPVFVERTSAESLVDPDVQRQYLEIVRSSERMSGQTLIPHGSHETDTVTLSEILHQGPPTDPPIPSPQQPKTIDPRTSTQQPPNPARESAITLTEMLASDPPTAPPTSPPPPPPLISARQYLEMLRALDHAAAASDPSSPVSPSSPTLPAPTKHTRAVSLPAQAVARTEGETTTETGANEGETKDEGTVGGATNGNKAENSRRPSRPLSLLVEGTFSARPDSWAIEKHFLGNWPLCERDGGNGPV